MRVDLKAMRFMWKQTVWGTVFAMVGVAALAVYFATEPQPDYQSVQFLVCLVILMPVLLGIAYLIRRLMERMAD